MKTRSEPGIWVTYSYCVSLVVLTLRRRSAPIFVPQGTSRVTPGIPYILLSMAFGWWGCPFGLIYTPAAIFENLGGGREEVGVFMTPGTNLCPHCGSNDVAAALGRTQCRACGGRW